MGENLEVQESRPLVKFDKCYIAVRKLLSSKSDWQIDLALKYNQAVMASYTIIFRWSIVAQSPMAYTF